MRKAKSFSHIGNHAINVLARLATKKAVQEQLRVDGVRVTLVRLAEISAKAQVYLADHPELRNAYATRRRWWGWGNSSPLSL